MSELSFTSRLKHAWNAFLNKDPTRPSYDYGASYGSRPDRIRLTRGNEKSIVSAVYNRIALDAASVELCHAKLDDNKRFLEEVHSDLNECLTLSANADQTGRQLIQDIVMSMMDEGSVAIVPVDTTGDPFLTSSYDIQSLRAGKIVEWRPQHVKIYLYNERTGNKEYLILPKSIVAIVENPFYAVMNEPSSTMQRLIRKLNILDAIDEQSGSGKMDVIIQLPFAIKGETRKKYAEDRRRELEEQLSNSKYGVGYIDATEHITQLNRAVENNLMSQIEYLTTMLYSQLGITQAIMEGTADAATMLNYYSRTIEPILSAVADEMKRKFLTKTARTQNHSIEFYRDPFKLVPVTEIAKIADTFTRNEIMTSNEIRQCIGMKPSDDPKADELRNANLSAPAGSDNPETEATPEEGEIQNGE